MSNQEVLSGIVLDEHIEVSTHEICRACASSEDWVIELVEEGILDAGGNSVESWRFSGVNLSRAIRVRRLQQDLELNLQGVALVLEMMEEIERLQQRLRHLDG